MRRTKIRYGLSRREMGTPYRPVGHCLAGPSYFPHRGDRTRLRSSQQPFYPYSDFHFSAMLTLALWPRKDGPRRRGPVLSIHRFRIEIYHLKMLIVSPAGMPGAMF